MHALKITIYEHDEVQLFYKFFTDIILIILNKTLWGLEHVESEVSKESEITKEQYCKDFDIFAYLNNSTMLKMSI